MHDGERGCGAEPCADSFFDAAAIAPGRHTNSGTTTGRASAFAYTVAAEFINGSGATR